MLLEERVGVVTGGAQGIGRAIAAAFAEEGGHVVICDVDQEKAEAAAHDLQASTGKRVLALKVDVTKKEDVESMVQRVIEEFGRIDVLVNNAGIWRGALLADMREEDWDAVFAVNVKGMFLCSQAVAKQMIKQRSGKIINIASTVGRGKGAATWGAYCASKAAAIMLTRVLAQELRPYGVEVNALCPGATETGMLKAITAAQGGDYRHAAKPEDQARIVVFLASDQARGVTGKDFTAYPWNTLERVKKSVQRTSAAASGKP